VSETFESSKSVRVAVVNDTSVTVAVHPGFGQEPAGAVGASDVNLPPVWPLFGVANGPLADLADVTRELNPAFSDDQDAIGVSSGREDPRLDVDRRRCPRSRSR
jgi:hypothetical protein